MDNKPYLKISVLVAAGDARYGSSSSASSPSSNAHHILPPGETSLGDPYFARFDSSSGGCVILFHATFDKCFTKTNTIALIRPQIRPRLWIGLRRVGGDGERDRAARHHDLPALQSQQPRRENGE